MAGERVVVDLSRPSRDFAPGDVVVFAPRCPFGQGTGVVVCGAPCYPWTVAKAHGARTVPVMTSGGWTVFVRPSDLLHTVQHAR